MADYTCASQQRILRVLILLGGHEVNGLAPAEIAHSLDITQPNTIRDLENLRIAGLAEKIADSGRWRLSPRLPQIAVAMLANIDRSQRKLEEVRQRYTREV
jgi:DNA-binding IclR family transcriptional regulator